MKLTLLLLLNGSYSKQQERGRSNQLQAYYNSLELNENVLALFALSRKA